MGGAGRLETRLSAGEVRFFCPACGRTAGRIKIF